MKLLLQNAILILISVLILQACSGDEPADQIPDAEPTLTAPFHFQRLLEIKPGLYYDLLSWGRGIDSATALLILRSDSTHRKFRSSDDQIEGKPLDAWDMDLDTDGNPEIVLEVLLNNNTRDLYIYEFDGSGNSQKIRFPVLSDQTLKGFKGKDSIYIKDGKLRRDFMYLPDAETKPYKRSLEYTLRSNSLIVNEIK